MVTTFYPPHHFGGDATYVRALSRALVKLGHEVEVIYCRDAYNLLRRSPMEPDVLNDGGVIVHPLSSPLGALSPLLTHQTGRPLLNQTALTKLLSRDFDVVNFHNISLVGGAAILNMSRSPVTLFTLHDHWLLCATHIFWKNRGHPCDRPQCLRCVLRSARPPQWWRYSRLIERSLSQVDLLLSPSEFTAHKHLMKFDDTQIRVLPLFSSLDPGPQTEYQPESRPRFVFAGRITATKGILPMLNTFSELPHLDLEVIGQGELLERVRRDYAHCRNIRFTGLLDQDALVPRLQNSVALIMPSLAPEVSGLAVMEALACGTPAIVHDAGGNRDMVDATGAGFVYSSHEQLAALVERLALDTALRAELGRKARAGYERQYTAQRHLDAYLGHIDKIRQRKRVAVH